MQRDCLGADQLSRQRLVGGLTIFAISGTASDVALSGKEYLSCKPFFRKVLHFWIVVFVDFLVTFEHLSY
jgi:hypothetical protein